MESSESVFAVTQSTGNTLSNNLQSYIPLAVVRSERVLVDNTTVRSVQQVLVDNTTVKSVQRVLVDNTTVRSVQWVLADNMTI